MRCVFTCGVHLTSVGSVGGGGGGGLLGARAVLGEHQHQGLLSHGLPRTLLCTLYWCTLHFYTAVLLYCPRHLVAGGDGGGADVEALGHVVLGHGVLQRQHIDLVRGILTTSNTRHSVMVRGQRPDNCTAAVSMPSYLVRPGHATAAPGRPRQRGSNPRHEDHPTKEDWETEGIGNKMRRACSCPQGLCGRTAVSSKYTLLPGLFVGGRHVNNARQCQVKLKLCI